MPRFILILTLSFVAVLSTSLPASASRQSRPWYEPLKANLPSSAWKTFTCIIYTESRSTWTHPNLGDNNRYGNSGIFQIEPGTWNAHVGPHMPDVWRANPREQAIGALNIWKADQFHPWADGCA